ncbi:enoyl-CoA hydratase/isomerase family protein [Tunicatimonas pelagia]|uniref:enoyl-CoA hydratase/isomerase family protein n=1 Tax=Tunicatimonas pelagia TaxID=931531 RepID=UPI002665A12C|nr:enoyl-CoA hydratase/isomerase family protein [Tunicatimonas pelagia]WKN44862.1 enoyl-CoA hydratase/isomerase family protein [Tunicatimonas pelagia]
MNPSAPLLTHYASSVLYLTLNRPKKLNCLDQEMLLALEARLAEAESDDAVRAVVLQGAGERAFSSGADLKAFGALSEDELPQWIALGHRVFNQVATYPKPTVAVIRGYAMGGGLELALACDLRIATEDALLALPELQHGWLPGWGGLLRLPRLVGEARAKEMILLGERLTAAQAHRWGLINRVCSAAELETATEQLTEALSALSPSAVRLAKSGLHSASVVSQEVIAFDGLALQQLLREKDRERPNR